MTNPWFRLYTEFAHDPKVQMLSEADQRRLVMLMCMRSGTEDETFHDCTTAFQLRITPEQWAETKVVFIASGFIDETNKLLNWDKRQYRSDSSTERVRKHRQAKRNSVKQIGNGLVTPPDTDTDTDTEKKDLLSDVTTPSGFDEFWKVYGKPVDKKQALAQWKRKVKTPELADKIVSAAKSYAGSREKQFRKSPMRWLRDENWTDEIEIKPSRGAEGSGPIDYGSTETF